MNKETKTPQSNPEPIQAALTEPERRELTADLKAKGFDDKRIDKEKIARIVKGGYKREDIYLQANRAGIIEAVKEEYIAEPLSMERMKKSAL